jgi:hypothetical protein
VTVHQQGPNGALSPIVRQTPLADNMPGWSFCAGDLNNDGFTDMMYGGGGGTTFMLSDANGVGFTEISPPQFIFCQRTNLVDLNNDGDLDAFSCHDIDANVYFLNDGAGSLNYHQGGLGPTCGNYGSIWTDYDNDGDQDLFIAKCGCDPHDVFMRNDGDLNFTSVAGQFGFEDEGGSWSSPWGDFDNDGDMDVLASTGDPTYHNKLMRNDGNGFTNVLVGSGLEGYNGYSIEWTTFDLDNDGYLDVICGGSGFLMGHGDMTFTPFPSSLYGAVGDANNDGFLDILNGSRVMLNQGNDNHWLTVSTVGTVSNANGIGARVRITSAMGTQIRDVRSGEGFRYMHSLNTHFGLGADSVITELTIEWPSGLVNTLHDVPADQPIVVVEGVSTSVQEEAEAATLDPYPSPAENTLFVRNGDKLGNRPMSILDASGKLVFRGTLRNGTVDVTGLSGGLYLLRVEGEEVMQARFVKR